MSRGDKIWNYIMASILVLIIVFLLVVGLLSKAASVSLTWTNEPSTNPASYETIVLASQDLSNWQIVLRVPYLTNPVVRLTNRPFGREFYTVTNWFKTNG